MKKKNKYAIIVTMMTLALGIGCNTSAQNSDFIEFIDSNSEVPKLSSPIQQANNTIELSFSGTISTVHTLLTRKKDGSTITHTQHINLNTEESPDTTSQKKTRLILSPTEAIAIGEEFVVHGELISANNDTFDFSLEFKGKNMQPACLQLSEVRPLYAGGKKKRPGFIELVVVESGNLSGIELVNVTPRITDTPCSYIFPPAEVRKGEYIVYHFRTLDDKNKDEITAKIVSGGTEACPKARDFWGNFKKGTTRKDNAILVRNSENGEIQDALLYFKSKTSTADATREWKYPEIAEAARIAVKAKLWAPDATPNAAVLQNITPTASLGRIHLHHIKHSATDWKLYKSNQVTMGLPNL